MVSAAHAQQGQKKHNNCAMPTGHGAMLPPQPGAAVIGLTVSPAACTGELCVDIIIDILRTERTAMELGSLEWRWQLRRRRAASQGADPPLCLLGCAMRRTPQQRHVGTPEEAYAYRKRPASASRSTAWLDLKTRLHKQTSHPAQRPPDKSRALPDYRQEQCVRPAPRKALRDGAAGKMRAGGASMAAPFA